MSVHRFTDIDRAPLRCALCSLHVSEPAVVLCICYGEGSPELCALDKEHTICRACATAIADGKPA